MVPPNIVPPGVVLPGSGRVTSRLGFGCARLFGGFERRVSLALLHAAFDCGIRHFDVAPNYGFGSAEEVVGGFLATHREGVTITTKFGLGPPLGKSLFRAARAAIKPLCGELPNRALKLARRLTPSPQFRPDTLEISLAASLRNLRCDFIDILLLHEAGPHDLTDELVHALDKAVADGWIGAWGIGSERHQLDRLSIERRNSAKVLQFEWSALSDKLSDFPGALMITHRALADAYVLVKSALADPARKKSWSAAARADFSDPRVLANWMLAAALAANPKGIVLFTSSRPSRIRENMSALSISDAGGIARFIECVRADCLAITKS